MRFVSIQKNRQITLGINTEDGILDVSAALSRLPTAGIPTDPMEVIRMNQQEREKLLQFVSRAAQSSEEGWFVKEEEIEFGPCVPKPSKIICVGLNYRKHADESNMPYPEVPLLFNKFPNSLTGHKQLVKVPSVTQELDYEVELGMVIGSRAADVSVEDALEHVFGYCTANDLSARDLQMRTSQWMLGKTSDGFCPIGPELVTADEIADPQNLELRTYVNGELRQNSNTKDMIFTCAEIISYISKYMTLEPGDLILTGTPEGVALGMPPEQRQYLKPGDVVDVEIAGLGRLTNRFV